MARYIDADKAILELKEMANNCQKNYLNKAIEKAVTSFLNNRTTADVSPIIHSKWEEIIEQKPVFNKNKEKIIETKMVRCQKCKKTNKQEKTVYCPYCGAKMDGD